MELQVNDEFDCMLAGWVVQGEQWTGSEKTEGRTGARLKTISDGMGELRSLHISSRRHRLRSRNTLRKYN